MTHKYEGFLYGHYDSRGGATFVEGTDRDKADKQYAEAFICEGYEGATPEQQAKEICEEDFLGFATVESPIEIHHGQDIDFQFVEMEPEWKLWVKAPDDPTEEAHYELRIAKEQPDGFEESELGEDAFGMVVLLAGKSTFEG